MAHQKSRERRNRPRRGGGAKYAVCAVGLIVLIGIVAYHEGFFDGRRTGALERAAGHKTGPSARRPDVDEKMVRTPAETKQPEKTESAPDATRLSDAALREFHQSEKPHLLGRFTPDPAVTVYLVSDTGALRARVAAFRKKDRYEHLMTLRAFDADENMTARSHVHQDRTGQGNAGEALPMERVIPPLAFPDGYDGFAASGGFVDSKPWHEEKLEFYGNGVFQLRVNATRSNVAVPLAVSFPLDYGVSFQNGTYTPWSDDLPDKMYVYVPPRATEIQLQGGPFRIYDETGALICESTENIRKAKMQNLKVDKTRAVWTVEFPGKDWSFSAEGFPFILCSSSAAAERIRASVEELDDGTVVCHKFQVRIHDVLQKILREGHVGRTEDLKEDLSQRLDAWLADPLRNRHLINPKYNFIRGVNHALDNQILDPENHWSGAFRTWSTPDTAARWDGFKRSRGLGGTLTPASAAALGLARAATLQVDLNPYYGKKELLFRAAAASLRDLMCLNEAEVWPGVGTYPSGMSFPMGARNLPAYALAAPHLPEWVREVWTEGLRRMVDRTSTDYLVTCMNQSSHYLVAYEEFAHGSGLAAYKELSRLFAQRFVEAQTPAGYFIECCGPCSSYIGMTHWHMGVYYRLSKDPAMCEAIRKSYRLFNHTVAPEPDGNVLGGFNFNHRVGMGFFGEQYNGARGSMHGVLPEVGLWCERKGDIGKEISERIAEAGERIKKNLAQPCRDFPGGLSDVWYLYYQDPDTSGTWPATEKGSFIRNFGDEFIAIRRPAYYTLVYVGKPAGSFYIRDKEKFRLPLPKDAENTGGEGKAKPATPYGGGGLSFFWTPEAGSMLIASNWSPLCRHGLVAVTADGKRWWEDYHAHSFALDEKKGTLAITGRIEGQPLSYLRTYTFSDDALDVRVEINASRDAAYTRFFENLPFPSGSLKARGTKLSPSIGKTAGSRIDSFTIVDNGGKGIRIDFKGKYPASAQLNGLISRYRTLQVNRVEIGLPLKLKKGERITLEYRITTVK